MKQDIQLDKWQKEMLDYKGDICLCTGRQVGKTLTMSRKASKYMLENKDSKIIIASLTEDQAKLIIVMIKDYFDRNYPDKLSTNRYDQSSTKITLNNGSQAIARPIGLTGDSIRGFTGDVLILDEASRMPEIVFEAAKPVLLTTAGKIWMCSTPFGKQGYFYNSWLNKSNRFKVFHITSEEVIKERPISKTWSEERSKAAIKFLESERKDMSELQYGQEYLGLFLEDLRRYFPDNLIEQCCILKRQIPSPKSDNYMGVDIARMGGDASSYEILHVIDDKCKQIENITTEKLLTTETERRIKEMAHQFNCIKIGIDAGSGSLGVGIYDHLLEDPETSRKVVAMNNRTISLDRRDKEKQRIFKEDLYDNFKSMMEHGDIELLDDEDLIASLHSIQFEFIKLEGQPTKVRIFGNDSHIVEGLIRAAWLAKKERHKYLRIHYI